MWHFMLETASLDDVGTALDLAADKIGLKTRCITRQSEMEIGGKI